MVLIMFILKCIVKLSDCLLNFFTLNLYFSDVYAYKMT